MRLALYALGTDGYFECPSRRVLQALLQGQQRLYHYIYAAQPANVASALGLPAWLDFIFKSIPPLKWLGAFHGSNEVLFWGAEDPSSGLTDEERRLGLYMVNSWVKFIHGQEPWGSYGEKEHYRLLSLQDDQFGGYGWHSDRCNILEQFRFIWNPLESTGQSDTLSVKDRREQTGDPPQFQVVV
eukprot:CAMPEP_0169186900 /NCGR_PEP_ID=MMETSP1016-20121227/2625_1 /TAXON_ID=342587 /ORGANISM="Karlodinium micrum, Strain CCMP2283" /LENGTH=183 /DNA_ID=CAMNT_0009262799 /DNA_START=1 /DNA_END=552 /DNA_ORIENTATION=+